MLLEIQKFLLTPPNKPEDLTEKFAIKVTRHKTFPNLCLFKYNQIDSPFAEEIVREARGIILDEADSWRVVCYSYKKFFNHGEGHAAKIDWVTAKCLEKLDGSLCQLFYYDGQWRVATSGMPDALGEYSPLRPGSTFSDLFWDEWHNLNYPLPDNHNLCYMFELMTPYNRIVCAYPESQPSIVLHGCRDLQTLHELPPEPIAACYGWNCVKSIPASNIEELMNIANALDPIKQEGYVVVDANFNRVKVKSPAYVALAHLIGNFSVRRMVEIVRNSESTDFIQYFPNFKELHAKVKTAYDALIIEVESTFKEIWRIESQKEFAMVATKTPYAGLLFGLRKESFVSAAEGFKKLNVDNAVKMLGLKEERREVDESV